MSDEYIPFRKPNKDEMRLLRALDQRAVPPPSCDDWIERLSVQPMDDGGMGSLRLTTDGRIHLEGQFLQSVAEIQFTDADGIEVIASLLVDKNGMPFELDIWKTDFSKLIKILDAID